ncbi:MAG TPA: LacI family DNA-binding transcriptional regulator [Gemmatimonadaceae bacterium]|nr:LacI family DNA-binding transcriptional regulator [Gemmatimonadaceae bacterium]
MSVVTLKDVAERCRVSTATVSAVVNGAPWVSEDTRVRVQRAVDDMGYRPNQFARGLKTQRGYAVGVIVSDLTNPFFTEVVRSLGHALREDGWALFLCDSDHRFDLGDINLRRLVDGHVVGLVIIGDSVREETLQSYMGRKRHIPIVVIERQYDMDGVNSLLVDSERAGHAVTEHLLRQGYRRIAMIGGPQQGAGSATYGRARRYRGYRRALESAGIALDDGLVAEGNFRYSGGQDAMRRLLAAGRVPEAVFAANDMMAFGAMAAIRDAGLRVPDDIAIVGFDDVPAAALSSPALTTVAMPKTELGNAAAAVLARHLAPNGRPEIVRRTFNAELIVRQSSLRPIMAGV